MSQSEVEREQAIAAMREWLSEHEDSVELGWDLVDAQIDAEKLMRRAIELLEAGQS